MSSRSAALPPPSLTEAGRALQNTIWTPRIGGLDFLRSIGVLMVMIEHSTEVGKHWLISSSASFFVTLFFVLSGFLITRMLTDELASKGKIDLKKFYQRRIARLMPAFYMFIGIAVLTLAILHKPIPWPAITSAIFYVTNYYQAFTGAKPVVVAHCWTLAVEEQFYLLWPLLLAWAAHRRWSLPRMLAGLIVATWVWRWFLIWGLDANQSYLLRGLDTRADDLLAGCLAAVLMRDPMVSARLAAIVNWRPTIPLVLGLLVLLLSFHGDRELRFGLSFVLEPLLGVILMLACVQTSHRNKGFLAGMLNQPFLVHIGQVSYGIYLYHGLFLYSVETKVSHLTSSPWLGLITAIGVLIVIATWSFRYVETPLRERISRI